MRNIREAQLLKEKLQQEMLVHYPEGNPRVRIFFHEKDLALEVIFSRHFGKSWVTGYHGFPVFVREPLP